MVVASFSNVIAAAGASSANALCEGAAALQISNMSVLHDPMKAVLGTLDLVPRDLKPMAVNWGCETGAISMV